MINTLDLDLITNEQLNYILTKIKNNSCCENIKWKCSDKKGFHVIISCLKECDLCRFVFDDDKRYAIDSVMPLRLRDFLFNEKVELGNLRITKENLEKIKDIVI